MTRQPSEPQPLDPTFAELLEVLPDMVFDTETLPVIRELLASGVPADTFDDVTVAEHLVDEAAGVVVRVFTPRAGGGGGGRRVDGPASTGCTAAAF